MIIFLLALSFFTVQTEEDTPAQKAWKEIVAAANEAEAKVRLDASPEESAIAAEILQPILKQTDIDFRAGKRNFKDNAAMIIGGAFVCAALGFGVHLSGSNDDVFSPLKIDAEPMPYMEAGATGSAGTGGLGLFLYGYNQISTGNQLRNLYQIKSHIDYVSMQQKQSSQSSSRRWLAGPGSLNTGQELKW